MGKYLFSSVAFIFILVSSAFGQDAQNGTPFSQNGVPCGENGVPCVQNRTPYNPTSDVPFTLNGVPDTQSLISSQTAATNDQQYSPENNEPSDTQATAQRISKICSAKQRRLYLGSEQNVTLQAAACLYYCYYTATNRKAYFNGFVQSQNSANQLCGYGTSSNCNDINRQFCKY